MFVRQMSCFVCKVSLCLRHCCCKRCCACGCVYKERVFICARGHCLGIRHRCGCV